MTDSHRPRSDGRSFVGLAAATAAAGRAFEPLGGAGAPSGQDGGFRPFHLTGADFGIADDATGMPGGFPVDLADLADEDGAAGLWDEGLLGTEALEGDEALEAGQALPVGDDDVDLMFSGADIAPVPDETGTLDVSGEDGKIAALVEQHDRELEAVRAECGEVAAERIRAGLAAMERHLLDEIGTQVARILAPILSSQARERSVEAFIDALRDMLADSEAVSVCVEGPPDLLGHVEAALGSADQRLEFKIAQGTDLRAQMAESFVMTRLGEWADELAGAVHAHG